MELILWSLEHKMASSYDILIIAQHFTSWYPPYSPLCTTQSKNGTTRTTKSSTLYYNQKRRHFKEFYELFWNPHPSYRWKKTKEILNCDVKLMHVKSNERISRLGIYNTFKIQICRYMLYGEMGLLALKTEITLKIESNANQYFQQTCFGRVQRATQKIIFEFLPRSRADGHRI